jgi:hypothetical protein
LFMEILTELLLNVLSAIMTLLGMVDLFVVCIVIIPPLLI